MADPVTTTLLVASTAVGAYSSVKGGQAKNAAYQAEARSKEAEARLSDLQSHQIASNRREELNANLAALSATRSARGTMSGSPTGLALTKGFTSESDRAREAEVLEPTMRARSSRLAAQSLRTQGSAAQSAGYLNAFSTVLGGGADIYGLQKKPKKAA